MNNMEQFVREINRAFAEGDKSFLLSNSTVDFCWFIVGERTICGKEAFSEALDQMQEMPPMDISVKNVIIEKNSAVVEGIVTGKNRLGQKKNFGFCDVLKFADVPDLKIREITSYVIDISKHKRYKDG